MGGEGAGEKSEGVGVESNEENLYYKKKNTWQLEMTLSLGLITPHVEINNLRK